MNLISNFVNKSFSAVFMLSMTSMVLAGLMIGTLTNHTILGFASVFVVIYFFNFPITKVKI